VSERGKYVSHEKGDCVEFRLHGSIKFIVINRGAKLDVRMINDGGIYETDAFTIDPHGDNCVTLRPRTVRVDDPTKYHRRRGG